MTQPTKDAPGSQANRALPNRALRRPDTVRAPAHWQTTTVPMPKPPVIDAAAEQPGGRDPVRYGDWEYKGLAIDF